MYSTCPAHVTFYPSRSEGYTIIDFLCRSLARELVHYLAHVVKRSLFMVQCIIWILRVVAYICSYPDQIDAENLLNSHVKLPLIGWQ